MNEKLKNINKSNLFFKSKNINNIVNKSYKKNKLMGFNISIKGRIKNSDRSKILKYNKGKIKKNSFNIFTHFSKHPINTKTGIWMIKINLLRNINQQHHL